MRGSCVCSHAESTAWLQAVCFIVTGRGVCRHSPAMCEPSQLGQSAPRQVRDPQRAPSPPRCRREALCALHTRARAAWGACFTCSALWRCGTGASDIMYAEPKAQLARWGDIFDLLLVTLPAIVCSVLCACAVNSRVCCGASRREALQSAAVLALLPVTAARCACRQSTRCMEVDHPGRTPRSAPPASMPASPGRGRSMATFTGGCHPPAWLLCPEPRRAVAPHTPPPNAPAAPLQGGRGGGPAQGEKAARAHCERTL